jgi:N,N'-diacetylchitobiose transport system substrate-binding protein
VYNGKVFGVPYYAGSRVITYRKDMFEQAGITAPPTSMDELKADADKLNAKFASKIKNFSAFYIPGQHWYLAGTLIADQGVQQPWAEFAGGKWMANVNSAGSIKGLDLFKELQSKYSKADPRGEEADQAYRMGGQKNIAMFYGAAWELGEVGNKDKGGDPKLSISSRSSRSRRSTPARPRRPSSAARTHIDRRSSGTFPGGSSLYEHCG